MEEAPTKKQRLVLTNEEDENVNWKVIARHLVEILDDDCKFSTKQCRICKFYVHEDEDGYTCTGECGGFLCEDCVTFYCSHKDEECTHDLENLICSECKEKEEEK